MTRAFVWRATACPSSEQCPPGMEPGLEVRFYFEQDDPPADPDTAESAGRQGPRRGWRGRRPRRRGDAVADAPLAAGHRSPHDTPVPRSGRLTLARGHGWQLPLMQGRLRNGVL